MVLRKIGIILPIWLIFFIFTASVFFGFVPLLKKNMLTQKKEAVKQLVETAESLLEGYEKRVQAGEMTLAAAQKEAISLIRQIRYGADKKDYFWINDYTPVMIMHPYSPQLENTDISDVRDPTGKQLFAEVVRVVRDKGEGYVHYRWQWQDDAGHIVPKMSYVKGFKPWGWILGTGIYIEDVNAEIRHVLKGLFVLTGLIFFLILAVSYYITVKALKIERSRTASVAKLEKSDKKHRQFIDNAPIGMCTIDTAGRITYVNKKLLRITGHEKIDWLNQKFEPMIHEADISILNERIRQRLSGRENPEAVEVRLYHKSGDIRWVRINAETIYKRTGPDEGIDGIQAFIEDITQMKTARLALRDSEERFRAILQAIPDPVVVYDMAGCPRYLNPSFTRVFGWRINELTGKNIPYVPDDQKKITDQKVREIFKKGIPLSFETKRYTKDGKLLDIFLSAAVYKDEDQGSNGLVVCLTDISKQKAFEMQIKQAQKIESIGTLSGGIAHDFNNILSIILGNTELAMQDIPAGHPAYAYLDQITVAGLKAAGIVKQLLRFSRKSEQQLLPISLSETVKESLDLLRSVIPASIDIRTRFEVQNDMIMADPVEMNQVIMNLCINASQAMEKGGGVMELVVDDPGPQSYALDENKTVPSVRLIVRDSGIGIAKETIDRIFDPYFTTKGIGEGSGMGLSVAHGIVTNHHGRIEVESEVGEGTLMSVMFPLIEACSIKKEERDVPMPGGNERILFVDDEPMVVDISVKKLEKLGYRVTASLDPEKALEMVKSDPQVFDLVISDMTMPKMNGDKLAQKIMDIRPDLPVIIITGHSAAIDEEKAQELGIAGYGMKPILMGEMAKLIRTVLEN